MDSEERCRSMLEHRTWHDEDFHYTYTNPEVIRLHQEAIKAAALATRWSKVAIVLSLISLAAFGYRLIYLPSCS